MLMPNVLPMLDRRKNMENFPINQFHRFSTAHSDSPDNFSVYFRYQVGFDCWPSHISNFRNILLPCFRPVMFHQQFFHQKILQKNLHQNRRKIQQFHQTIFFLGRNQILQSHAHESAVSRIVQKILSETEINVKKWNSHTLKFTETKNSQFHR